VKGASVARENSFTDTIRELWELLRDYAKQETIDPIKGLAKYIGWGLIAATLMATGIGLLLLGTLRGLQTDTHRFIDDGGRSSVAPYLLILVFTVVLILLLAKQIPKQFGDNDRD
jgi:hypothetical protein